MYGYIYITTNKVNNKKYIGQHRSSIFTDKYKGSGKILWEAINKYGWDNFEVKLLEWCKSEDDLNEREKYWIKYYDAVKSRDFYNVAHGGHGGWLPYDKHGERNPMYGKRGDKCPHYGRRAMTDGKITIYVDKSEIDHYIKQGYMIGKDQGYCDRMQKAKSDLYYLDEVLFYGSYKLREYLRNNGYPKISQTAIYKLADGKRVRGYDDLYLRIRKEKHSKK